MKVKDVIEELERHSKEADIKFQVIIGKDDREYLCEFSGIDSFDKESLIFDLESRRKLD